MLGPSPRLASPPLQLFLCLSEFLPPLNQPFCLNLLRIPRACVSSTSLLDLSITTSQVSPLFFLPRAFLCGVSLQRVQSLSPPPPPAVFDSLLRIRGIKVSNSRDVPAYGRAAAFGCRSAIRSPTLPRLQIPQIAFLAPPQRGYTSEATPTMHLILNTHVFFPGKKSAT